MKIFGLTLLLVVFWGCSGVEQARNSVVVSIAPLSWIVSNLTDSTVSVSVMVPQGSSPESYEPTIRQMQALSGAKAYIATGLLDFEGELSGRIKEIAPDVDVVDLSQGMDLITGGHHHDNDDDHNHDGGVDPHIWLSPRMMHVMVDKVAELLVAKNINPREAVYRRADSLKGLIDSLDNEITRLTSNKTIKFAIVHPSLSYFARDYGLTQIAIEIDGKEPSAKAISEVVNQLKANGVKFVLYDVQNSDAAAKVVAMEINGTLINYNPLDGEWLQGMQSITKTLCN